LCQRLRDAGWRLVGDERLVSIHHGDPKTLARLFHAERWRGRDNLRVTFRTRLRARDLPSIIAPILIALAVPASVLAAVLAPVTHGRSIGVAVASASLVVALIMVRTVKIATAGRVWQPVSLTRALAVAATYELARAAALVTRAAHHRETSVTDPRPFERPGTMTPIRVLELRSVWGTGGGPDKTILNGAALDRTLGLETVVCYIRDARDTGFTIDKRAQRSGA
jgi:hypothetical protein